METLRLHRPLCLGSIEICVSSLQCTSVSQSNHKEYANPVSQKEDERKSWNEGISSWNETSSTVLIEGQDIIYKRNVCFLFKNASVYNKMK